MAWHCELTEEEWVLVEPVLRPARRGDNRRNRSKTQDRKKLRRHKIRALGRSTTFSAAAASTGLEFSLPFRIVGLSFTSQRISWAGSNLRWLPIRKDGIFLSFTQRSRALLLIENIAATSAAVMSPVFDSNALMMSNAIIDKS